MPGFDDRNVIPLFINRYEQLFAGSWAMDLSLYVPNSMRGTEVYGMLGGYPKMREWIGARQAQVTAQRATRSATSRTKAPWSCPNAS